VDGHIVGKDDGNMDLENNNCYGEDSEYSYAEDYGPEDYDRLSGFLEGYDDGYGEICLELIQESVDDSCSGDIEYCSGFEDGYVVGNDDGNIDLENNNCYGEDSEYSHVEDYGVEDYGTGFTDGYSDAYSEICQESE